MVPVMRKVRAANRCPEAKSRLRDSPRPVFVTVALVDVLAVALVSAWLLARLPGPADVGWSAVLTAGGLVSAELTWRLERHRRQLSDLPHTNMSSVAVLATTLVAGPVMGAAAAAVLYLHLWWRVSRWTSGIAPYRAVFNTSAMIVPACVAYGVVHLLADGDVLSAASGVSAPVLLAGIATFWLVNTLAVGAVIVSAEPQPSWAMVLGDGNSNALEVVTLVLGVLTAVLAEARPWLALLVFPLVYVLHRGDLARHFEVAASTDGKTGLLNMGTWTSLARAGVAKARRNRVPVAVLMLDLDFFKRINDTHGHLVGDEVLRAVAGKIEAEVRRTDLVGRYGGEEFVVFLSDASLADAVGIAERIRAAVAALQVPSGDDSGPVAVRVSIGIAADDGLGEGDIDLSQLLLAADTRLFGAKNQGRDRVNAG